jgi:branched-subunit amino acid aminotransferase/4-amino-4-deoxychorismate lyase
MSVVVVESYPRTEMIWHEGRIILSEDLEVSIDDRVFEHGLGLFETLRTWAGRAPLLPRHLDRLRASALTLDINLSKVRLPDRDAVTGLVNAAELGGDVLLRLTLTAGSGRGLPPVCWLVAKPLPGPEPTPLSARVHRFPGEPDDVVHRHKMLNYWGRRMAYEFARKSESDEALFFTRDGLLCEGSRNNVLVVPAGRPRVITTPPLSFPILPGIMRRVALDFAASRGYAIEETSVDLKELFDAEAVFLTNSVRGVRPVGRIDDTPVESTGQDELIRLFTEELPRYIRSLPDDPEPKS